MKKKHVAFALAAAMAVTTVGGATVYASEEHGPSSEAAPAWENYDATYRRNQNRDRPG